MTSKNRKLAFTNGFRGYAKRGFNPASVAGLLQYFNATPTIDGAYVDSANKGTPRPIQLGRCYQFDGVDDYVDSGSPVTGGKAINTKLSINADITGNRGLVACGGHTASSRGYSLRISGSSINMLYANGTAANNANFTGFTVDAGTDYDIEFDWDGGASVPTITVNGTVYSASKTVFGWSGESTQNLVFGAYNAGNTAHYNGKMWGVALLVSGLPFLHYKMDEQGGTTAFDSSGNDNHGTITNATLSTFHATQDVISFQNDAGYTSSYTVDDTLIAPNITLTDMTFTINTRDATQRVILFTDSTISSLLLTVQAGSTVAISNGFGAPVFTIDEVSFTGNRDELYDLLYDGQNHDVVISNITYTGNLYYGGYDGFAWGITGQAISNVTLNGVAYDGTTFIPRNEANPTLDALGNSLQYTGHVPMNGQAIDSNCITLSGAGGIYHKAPAIPATGDFVFEIELELNSITGTQALLSQYAGGAEGRFRFGLSNDHVNLFIGGTGGASVVGSIPLVVGGKYTFKLERIGGAFNLYVNNSLDVVATSAISIMQSENTIIGVGGGGIATSAIINRYSIVDGSGDYLLHVPCSMGAGTFVADVSPQENHGALTGTTLSSVYANTQDDYHYNLANGASKYIFFNDTTDHINLNVTPDELMSTGVFDMEIDFMWDEASYSSFGRLLWFITDTGFFRLQKSTNSDFFQLWARKGAGQDIISAVGFAIPSGSLQKLRLLGNGSTVEMWLNDVLINTRTINTANLHTPNWTEAKIGSTTTTIKALVSRWSLSTATVTQELVPRGNTNDALKDLSGNSNDATIGGSPDVIYIPAATATTDALGTPLTNPPIAGHNGTESKIDFTGGVASAKAVQGGWETDWAFNDARTNPLFKRTITEGGAEVGADRFLAYETVLSGDDLTKVNDYTATKET